MLKEQTTKRIYGVMHTQFSNVSSPDGHGWKIDEEGVIDYKWTSGFIVSQKLIDIHCVKPSETSKEVEEGTRILPQKKIT